MLNESIVQYYLSDLGSEQSCRLKEGIMELWGLLRLSKLQLLVSAIKNLRSCLIQAQITVSRNTDVFIPFKVMIVAYSKNHLKPVNMLCQHNTHGTCGNYRLK